jgi:hypothetical protein
VTSEQQPPVNNGYYFWDPRVVVVHKFDCTNLVAITGISYNQVAILASHFDKLKLKFLDVSRFIGKGNKAMENASFHKLTFLNIICLK